MASVAVAPSERARGPGVNVSESARGQQIHRFELRPSGSSSNAGKLSAIGRRVLSHTVEAQKAAAAALAVEREQHPLAGKPQRLRAALEWLRRRQQERQQDELTSEAKAKVVKQLPVWKTSRNNPLNIQQQGEDEQEEGEEHTLQPASSGAAAMGSSGAASGAAAEGQEAQQEDGGTRGRKRTGYHLEAHLITGSLAPLQGSTPSSDGKRLLAAQAALLKQQEHDELLEALAAEYPHGIPRKVLLDLRALGVSDAPSVGFGSDSPGQPLAFRHA